jgi:hypothetical protein
MGAKISVCPILPASNTKSAWLALDTGNAFTRVKGIIDGGNFGGSYELGSEVQLEDGETMKWKGARNSGSSTFAILLKNDPGQDIMAKAAEGDPDDPDDRSEYLPIGFKYEFSDGRRLYYPALVMGWNVTVGGANDALKVSPNIEVVARPVWVEAA